MVSKYRLMQAGIVLPVLAAVIGGGVVLANAGGGSGSTSASAADVASEAQTVSLSADDQTSNAWVGIHLEQASDGPTVEAVIADSPADKAGLQRGDVITAVGGTAVSDVGEVHDALEGKAAGDTVVFTITRDGSSQDVSVTLEERPEALPQSNPIFPELDGLSRDELFSHVMGGEYTFTDADGNTVTAVLEAGTVASVDADNGKLTVDLNAGGSKTYTVEDGDMLHGDLSDYEEGDNVTVLSVNDDVRAVLHGGGMPFMPGMGGRFGHGGGHRGFEFGSAHIIGPGGEMPFGGDGRWHFEESSAEDETTSADTDT